MYILNSCLIGKIQDQRLILLNMLVGFGFVFFLNLLVWMGLILILEHMQRTKNLNLRRVFVFFSHPAGIINAFLASSLLYCGRSTWEGGFFQFARK